MKIVLLFMGTLFSVFCCVGQAPAARVDDHAIEIIPQAYVSAHEYERDLVLERLNSRITFTRSGVQHFLHDIFSDPQYTQLILPHTFDHMIEFFEYGKNSHQNSVYVESTVRLFANGVKYCPYINPDGFRGLLVKLQSILEAHMVKPHVSLITEAKTKLKNIMYSVFLSRFSFFKEDPDAFFDDLTTQLIQEFNNTHYMQHVEDNERLHQQIVRFLEVVIGKLMWAAADQSEVWVSVKEISEYLHQLAIGSIITQEDLDDLYQSLLARFIYFLQIAGSDLSMDVIEQIKADIAENRLLLLSLEEQEDFLESKSHRLKRIIDQVEARIIAQTQTTIIA